ncbi:hypothetical protein N7449_002416 [Penicillium cf. viridicatum]|uniref:Uncharacterized protein n=1 Tax=Penicillium cf. viridicatum TaxID=2972119 RepID=A0A9W9T3E4_9EURO|nr:hypothetical protein N7449_002416 [Penicillium cf. viridicatum]
MSTAPTTISRTLVVHEPSAPSSSPHSATPSIPRSSTAVENLSKLPGGLWALLILVAAAVVSGIVWFIYITNKKKKEEKGEEGSKPNETEGIPLDTLTVAAAMTPQATLNLQWLRESQAAVHPGSPGIRSPPSSPCSRPARARARGCVCGVSSPRPKKRDPAVVSATTTAGRNFAHGVKEAARGIDPAAVVAVAPPA